jgi:hypothetical protein
VRLRTETQTADAIRRHSAAKQIFTHVLYRLYASESTFLLTPPSFS